MSLKGLFSENCVVDGESGLDMDGLAFLVCRGGGPLAMDLERKTALRQVFDYYDAVVESDINRADGMIKNSERARRIMRSRARNQGTQAACTVIADDIMANEAGRVNEDTVHSYIVALKKIFVVEDIPAWNPNLRSKSVIHMTDTRYYVDSSIVGARSLLKLRGMIDTTRMKETSFLIILTGIGQYAYCRGDGVLVVSVGVLKN